MTEDLQVLVVDDDPAILDMFKDYFHARGGVTFHAASDGLEALSICAQKAVDFCFTDLHMPGMDGVELVNRIQEVDNTIPVVVMTGFPSTESAIATLKNGVVDFLVKPFKIQNIGLTIQKVMEKRDLLVENLFLKEEVRRRDQLASVNQELSEKVHDLKVLNRILQKVEWMKTSASLYDLIVRLCAEVTGSDESYFHVFDAAVGRPVLVACWCGDGGKEASDGILTYVESMLAERLEEGMPFLVKEEPKGSVLNAQILSVIGTPLKIRGNVFGIITAVREGAGPRRFTAKELYYLNFIGRRTASVVENVALYENIYENLFCTLFAFVEAIEARDPYTKQHSSRVAELSHIIGKEMGCSHEEMDLLHFSGHLHDVGKIGIRDSILLKPGRLTKEEFQIIKQHPIIGENIIGHLGLMSEERKVIRHHHERWDGSGYPDGLRGEEIPFLSRILAVADVYDAMASDRAYRRRIPEDEILRTIRVNAGTQFDGKVVAAFLSAYERGALTTKQGPPVSVCPKQPGVRFDPRMLGDLRGGSPSAPCESLALQIPPKKVDAKTAL